MVMIENQKLNPQGANDAKIRKENNKRVEIGSIERFFAMTTAMQHSQSLSETSGLASWRFKIAVYVLNDE